MSFIIKVFPVAAIIVSLIAYCQPGLFSCFDYMIVPLLGLIILGMGSTLSPEDFLRAAKNPRAVCIGLVLQFTLRPLLAFTIGKLLDLPLEQLAGMVMVGTVAGGTASNVITYLAGGDVALSITMTACSTAAGIVMTPLLSAIYLGTIVEVQPWAMFKSILMIVALPVTLGLIVNRLLRKCRNITDKVCPVFSSVGIVLVIGVIVSLNAGSLAESGAAILLAVILHNISGMACGYFFARALKCDSRTAVTIAIEVGMQNSGLATALSKNFFGAAAALPGAVFSIWHNISGAIFAAAAKHYLNSQNCSSARCCSNNSSRQ